MRSESSTSANGGGGPSNRASAPTCMCELAPSCARNDASSAVRRSKCCCAMVVQPYPAGGGAAGRRPAPERRLGEGGLRPLRLGARRARGVGGEAAGGEQQVQEVVGRVDRHDAEDRAVVADDEPP